MSIQVFSGSPKVGSKWLKRFNVSLFLGLLLVVAVLSAGVVFSMLQANSTLQSAGAVKTVGVGVYSDSALTIKVTSITWGTLEPGANVNKTVYVQNLGNVPIKLSLSTSNYSPLNASTYLALTWNYGGSSVNAGSSISVKLTLKLSSTVKAITTFKFDVTIVGSG